MSSISEVGESAYRVPQFNEASLTFDRIQSQVDGVSDLFNEIEAILKEMSRLEPPDSEPTATFEDRLKAFNQKLAALNRQVEQAYRKLGQTQAVIQKLSTQDLPQAERRDAERFHKATEQARKAMDAASKALESRKDSEEKSLAKQDKKIALRVFNKKLEIRLKDDPSFKDIINAFCILSQHLGDVSKARTGMQQAELDLGLTTPEFLSGADERFIENLAPKDVQKLVGLGKSAAAVVSSGQTETSNNETQELQGVWADYIGSSGTNSAMDVNALVQFVLREAYMENTRDLHFYAQKVRFYNELKKTIRNELTSARELLSFQAGRQETASIVYESEIQGVTKGFHADRSPFIQQEFVSEPDMTTMMPQSPKAGAEVSTKAQLEAYIKGLEEKLNSVGDDAQLANVDLQNILQKQQQTLQMMSNISKMLHDTAMAIIRKIG